MTSADGSPLPGARLPFSATAYCKGTTTASGVGVRTRHCGGRSVAPAGRQRAQHRRRRQRYNGVYTVMDTGPKVQGRLLDLYMWSCHEALNSAARTFRSRSCVSDGIRAPPRRRSSIGCSARRASRKIRRRPAAACRYPPADGVPVEDATSPSTGPERTNRRRAEAAVDRPAPPPTSGKPDTFRVESDCECVAFVCPARRLRRR